MNTLFNSADASGIIERIEQLTPETQRLCEKINVTQMLSHCDLGIKMARDL